MSEQDVTTPGTEPTPVADGASTETTPAPEADDLQTRYDNLLGRIDSERASAAAEASARAEAAEQENQRLRDLIGQRMGMNAPPATPSAEQDELRNFWFNLHSAAQGSQNPNERAAARFMIAMAERMNMMPQEFEERLALTGLPENQRSEVSRIQKEIASATGEQISAKTAREILKRMPSAQPSPASRPQPPPGTRVVPVPVQRNPEADGMTVSEFGAAWRNAKTGEERDKLWRMEQSGKVRPD